MSARPDNKNFTNLTEKEWTEFLSHRLPPEKESEFLKNSKDNEFLQEALEGINLIENRSHVLSSVNNINAKIKGKVGSTVETKLSQYHFNYIQIGAIAAIFIVVIGIGSAMFYFMNNIDNEHIAQTTAVTVESSETPAPVVNSDAAAPISAANVDSSVVSANEVSATSAISTTTTKDVASGNAAAEIPAAAPKTMVTKPVTEQVATKMSEPKAKQPTVAAAPPAVAAKSAEMAPAVSGGYTKAADFKTTAAPAAAAGEVMRKEEVKSLAKKEDVNTASGNYQRGIAEMDKGNADEAIKSFDKVIEQNSGYKVDAKWNKAQMLLKKGEAKKAIKILKELAENENPYKNRAQDLLKKLE